MDNELAVIVKEVYALVVFVEVVFIIPWLLLQLIAKWRYDV